MQTGIDDASPPPSGAAEPAAAVTIVLATYNERSNIEQLLPELLALPIGATVVVVDDGSPDGTSEAVETIAKAHPGRVELIRRAGKMGYGSAFVAGFRHALERGAGRIVSLDADYSHDPQSIPAMVAALGEADLIIGSRYVGGIRILNWSFWRLMLSTGANFYVRTLLGFRCRDCTSGFRAYRAETLRAIDLGRLHAQGYAFLVEVLEATRRRRLRIGEVPIVYHERREGQSKMTGKVIYEALYRPLLLLARRLTGR